MLKNIPVGTEISLVEMFPGRGAQMARSAGSSVSLMSVEGDVAQLKLASGELRIASADCWATIGQVSNPCIIRLLSGKPDDRAGWECARPCGEPR